MSEKTARPYIRTIVTDHDPSTRDSLRRSFSQDAQRYDRARPGYPKAVFDDLVALGILGAGRKVLEIGCGTGQATIPLARVGCEVLAMDMGAESVQLAQQKLASFPRAKVIHENFESWSLSSCKFDAIVIATAFHWIDPAIRVSKSSEALVSGGWLVLINTHHIAGGTATFWPSSQRCYEQFDPRRLTGMRLPTASEVVTSFPDEISASGCFNTPDSRRYQWDHTYRTGEYLDLLMTFAGHRQLEDFQRESLLRCIANCIDSYHNGVIVKRHLTEVLMAQRCG